jgi:hypothetical protein
VLIDFVDTFSLDPATFPINVGDELISVNGIGMDTWINVLGAYSVNGNGNHVSRDRLAVATTLDRYQGWYTFASKIQPGDIATIVLKTAGSNKRSTVAIPWQTIFLPLLEEGPVPNPKGFSSLSKFATPKASSMRSMKERGVALKNPWHTYTGVPAPRMARLKATTATTGAPTASTSRRRLRQFSAIHADHVLAGGLEPFGSFVPLFNPPPGFQLRLGAGAEDEFLSGTFPVGNKLIGFIRISSFAPFSEANAVAQFQAEASFFQANADGLVVDIMSNGGGDGCYVNVLAQSLIPQTFQPLRIQVRATELWIQDFEIALIDAEFFGSSQETIDVLVETLEQIQQALAQKRGLTGPIDGLSPAACFLTGGAQYPPATDADGNNIAFTKPIVVLTNNFTLSAQNSSAPRCRTPSASPYTARAPTAAAAMSWGSTPLRTPKVSRGSRCRSASAITTSTHPASPARRILKTSASIPTYMPTTRPATIFSTAVPRSFTASPTSSTN